MPEESGLLVRLGQIVGLVAGAATLVYLIGGVVLIERLWLLDFQFGSALAIVPQLPREVVISEGLNSAVMWAFLAGAVYFAVRLVSRFERTPPDRPRAADSEESRKWVVKRVLVAGAMVVVVDAVVVGLRFTDGEGPPLGSASVALLAGTLVVMSVVYVAYDVRSRIAERYSTVREWNSAPAIALVAALVAAPVAPATAVISGTTTLPSAKVCTLAGYEEIGLLVAETDDEVFLGESKFQLEGERRVLAVPLDRVEQLFVGFGAFEAECESRPG